MGDRPVPAHGIAFVLTFLKLPDLAPARYVTSYLKVVPNPNPADLDLCFQLTDFWAVFLTLFSDGYYQVFNHFYILRGKRAGSAHVFFQLLRSG